MWKIIPFLILYAKTLDAAPSGCIEMCTSHNAYQQLNCCGLPMTLDDDQNYTNHNDFETRDGALVHKKDGKFSHGNTRGSFNEMSYYKEWGTGMNHNAGSNGIGSNLGLSGRIEDFGTTQDSFESMFESQYSSFLNNFRESLKHLRELKQKGQLQIQDCFEPCVPINEQIALAEKQFQLQQQQMNRLREEFWSRFQGQHYSATGEHVEQVPVRQVYHQPSTVVQEKYRHQYELNKQTQPQMITRVTYPVRQRVIDTKQTHGSSSKQFYQEESMSHHGTTPQEQVHREVEQRPHEQDQGEAYTTGIQSQAGYDTQNAGYGGGSMIKNTQSKGYISHGTLVQEDSSGYGSQSRGAQSYGSQSHGAQSHDSQSRGAQSHDSQSRGAQSYDSQSRGAQSYGSQSHQDVGFGAATNGAFTVGAMDLGQSVECVDESHHHNHHHQSYKQYRRNKRSASSRSRDFAETEKTDRVSQQEIELLGQQAEDLHQGKFNKGHQQADLTQQSENLNQRNEDSTGPRDFDDDFSQQSVRLESGRFDDTFQRSEQSATGDSYQKIRGGSSFRPFGKLELEQEHQSPSQSEQMQNSFQQITDNFPQQSNQETVKNLKLNQSTRNLYISNQFPTPVLAPDTDRSKNQSLGTLNHQFDDSLKFRLKPTPRSKNPESVPLNQDQIINNEQIHQVDHERLYPKHSQVDVIAELNRRKPSENLRSTGRGDISAEDVDSAIDQTQPPVISQNIPDIVSSNTSSHEELDPQVPTPQEESSQNLLELLCRNFSELLQRSREFSQRIQPSYSIKLLQEPRDSYEQTHTFNEYYSLRMKKLRKKLPRESQTPRQEFSEFGEFSDFPQYKIHKDSLLSRYSNNNKYVTQLPQQPKSSLIGEYHRVQDNIGNYKREEFHESQMSHGTQWRHYYDPRDSENENLGESISSRARLRRQERAPAEINQNQESDLRPYNEITELNLKSRILEAYGGKGAYDPMHNEDIFNSAKLNPSATLPPYIDEDPWDVREKPSSTTPEVRYEESVTPADTTWIVPNSFHTYQVPPTLQTIPTIDYPIPGFWDRFRRRLSSLVDKAKEKARDIFG